MSGDQISGLAALRVTAVVEQRARTDANKAVENWYTSARLAAVGRAEQIITPARLSTSPERIAMLREWYRRVFHEQVRIGLAINKLETAITTTEIEQVAKCVRDGEPRRILGPNGIPVMWRKAEPVEIGVHTAFPDAFKRNMDDDKVAAKQRQLAEEMLARRHAAEQKQAEERAWADEEKQRVSASTWAALTSAQRAAFAHWWIEQWLEHQGPLPPMPPEDFLQFPVLEDKHPHLDGPERIEGLPQRQAAAEMFAERTPTETELSAARHIAAKILKPATGLNERTPYVTDRNLRDAIETDAALNADRMQRYLNARSSAEADDDAVNSPDVSVSICQRHLT